MLMVVVVVVVVSVDDGGGGWWLILMVVVLGCDLIVGAGGYTIVGKDMTIPLAISLQAMAMVPCSIKEPICKTVDDLSSESSP